MKFILIWYGLVNLSAAVAVVHDKAAAIGQRRRTPERTLHVLALLGGWPASWLAQRMAHHKTRKVGFQVIFWLCALAHCVAVTLLAMQGQV